MKVQELLIASQAKLRECGISDPIRDARLLLADCLELRTQNLNLLNDSYISEIKISKFWRMVKERCKRKPVSKILGYRSFWGRDFEINENVLDPRGDTETLIELILDCKFENMLELGTGSGAIAITVLAERPEVTCVATDISEYALKTASTNSKRHGVESRLKLLHSNWFDKISGSFDVIVSNPPYISSEEYAQLSAEVVKYDPKISLTLGGDGLEAYREILSQALEKLSKNGHIFLEIGYTQANAVGHLFREAGFQQIKVHKDLGSRDRVISAKAS
ncbi:MAG: protein-(glutamine-N5) methyltransferase, release factor-specific [Rhodobacteraceae bacterium]|nr:protein-(glutamine-N5) methyltransferase, release factor-specific [Paracoccaceae bacterium]